MIAEGTMAPDFDCDTSTGRIHLKDLRGAPVVLYFYPEADTPGCTIESKRFRDLLPEFQAKGVRILGISTDAVPKQQKFADHCGLPFPLIADVSKKITESYGVLSPGGKARRTSFLIDPTGTVVEVVDTSSPLRHPEAAVRRFLGPEAVERLKPRSYP
ncbi:MAG: peroxiredoxin [Thermoplasmata archaeon]|nr:peroxiredoxin [Thermoplasmata archaeon]